MGTSLRVLTIVRISIGFQIVEISQDWTSGSLYPQGCEGVTEISELF